ncbi:TPA: hypothetical protein ACP32N_005054 [Pseudomonas aeruginosa]
MKYIRGIKVFGQAEEIRIVVMKEQIELHAEGLYSKLSSLYSGDLQFEVALDQAYAAEGEPLFHVKHGFTSYAWFTEESEALKFTERLRQAVQEQQALRLKEGNSQLSFWSLKSALPRRAAEFAGIVMTSLVIAFVGGVVAYPGWQLGQKLFSDRASEERQLALLRDLGMEKILPAEKAAVLLGDQAPSEPNAQAAKPAEDSPPKS